MILERRQIVFFSSENFKNQKKIEKIIRFQFCFQIRISDGLIDHFQLLNVINSTSRKSRKQQRL